MAKQYWLMKSEPDEFGIDDLKKVDIEPWSGVRNYQARNFMRDSMKVGDEILFYHSSTRPPGIAGLAVVASTPYPDPSQFNSRSDYYDPKSLKEDPRWVLVDVKFKETFPMLVTLESMKTEPILAQMKVLQKGSRLSITPVTKEEFLHLCKMGRS